MVGVVATMYFHTICVVFDSSCPVSTMLSSLILYQQLDMRMQSQEQAEEQQTQEKKEGFTKKLRGCNPKKE